jgi:hypothetical protein
MKLTVKQLRQIIREMALEKVSTPAGSPPRRKSQQQNYQSVMKYFSSQSWQKKAETAFRFIDAPIWVIPTYAKERINIGRLHILSWRQTLNTIKKSQFNPQDVKQHLANGGTVLIVNARFIDKGLWPSPWMTLHAIFDDTSGQGAAAELLDNTTIALEDWVQNSLPEEFMSRFDTDDEEASQIFLMKFLHALAQSLTMKSARDGVLTGESTDIIPEMLTQSVVSSKGCVINPFNSTNINSPWGDYTPEEINFINEKLSELQGTVNNFNAREQLNDIFKGNIVLVNVI